ncbi:MAG: winged helix DNA-binding domain-containing protein [Saccharothrix sp.]|nr:winged helix DNA-binding domain-containing protein [Saccharothrix sp.]
MTAVRRMWAQRLVAPARDLAGALDDVLALPAPNLTAAGLAVRARTTGLTPGDLRAALAGGEVVRTWAMRGAVHLLRRRDVRWVVALLGPVNAARSARGPAEAGLDDARCATVSAAVREVLTEPLTRDGLLDRLAEVGVRLDERQAAPALTRAAHDGVLCLGESTYHPVPQEGPEHDVTELVRRYLRAHGPATADDFATWSGLDDERARDAFRRERADGVEPVEAGTVRLLGHSDGFLAGYRDLGLLLDPADEPLLRPGGRALPHVVVDGRVRGTWRRRAGRVVVEQFGHIPAPELDAEVASVAEWV